MNGEFKDKIDKLIINSPFKEPPHHWEFDKTKGKFHIVEDRRKAGYIIASQSKKYSEQGEFIDLPLVNRIRLRIKKWRENGYAGVTGITKRLLEFWRTKDADGRVDEFFFCQLEAIETLIWLTEAPSSERVGIEIENDGGEFTRLCCKMATGTGKTYVMAMTIAWQILNKVTYPQDKRFSKNIFVIAPNLTVKSRLDVLKFNAYDNYYEQKKIVPHDFMEKLRQGKIIIENWHKLMWEKDEQLAKKRSVDKRGALSNEAWIRETLGDMAKARNILIINDEAHHAWRTRREDKQRRGISKEEVKMATCWIEGLDRIHKTRGILSCYDFSATPFSPSGTKGKISYREDLFKWIVSDFGLMDAIESGLTKTPRFVVRDDAPVDPETYRSKLYHIYDDEDVKTNLNRKAKETETLPELVQNAYLLLGFDWQKTLRDWQENEMPTPPVMISAVNRTETADRVAYTFNEKRINLDELCNEEKTITIHSELDEKTGKQQEILRKTANTVGQRGKEGEYIQHVVSVAMLSEGWNCQTVTHIMGLRAFSSQLLCEQIVGRGLRRTSYELNDKGMFEAEYVNIFGIPFAFIPQEEAEGESPRPTSPRIPIFPDRNREQYKITYPNIERIDYHIRPYLSVDFAKVEPLEIKEVRAIVELAPVIDGQPDYDKITPIELEKLVINEREQTILFTVTQNIYDRMEFDWQKKINKEFAFGQLFAIVQEFLHSDKLNIEPKSFRKLFAKTQKNVHLFTITPSIVPHVMLQSGALQSLFRNFKRHT